MDNPTRPEIPNPASFPASAPPPAPVEAANPCTTLALSLFPVPGQEPTPPLAPIPDPAHVPASVPEPTPSPAPAGSASARLPEHLMCKNRLQEYTQRSSLQLPIYQTVNEGSSHAPRFRSTVWVDGTQYTSPNTFLHRKAAEQDVAKLALEGILRKVKDEGCPLVAEDAIFSNSVLYEYAVKDTIFCKSILNEFAVKANLEKPMYNTVQLAGLLPFFVSTLAFDGVSYTGDTGRNKKEAEQLAARTVILSLLGNSGSSRILYEIIKSKVKLYAALDKARDPSHAQRNTVPEGINVGQCSQTAAIKEEVVGATMVSGGAPISAISQPPTGTDPPRHEFKRSRLDPEPKAMPFPIAFVHPNSEQPLGTDVGCSSNKKRRKKKKASKNANANAQFPIDAVPLNQASPCSVAQ